MKQTYKSLTGNILIATSLIKQENTTMRRLNPLLSLLPNYAYLTIIRCLPHHLWAGWIKSSIHRLCDNIVCLLLLVAVPLFCHLISVMSLPAMSYGQTHSKSPLDCISNHKNWPPPVSEAVQLGWTEPAVTPPVIWGWGLGRPQSVGGASSSTAN